jgi:hypothetical protein
MIDVGWCMTRGAATEVLPLDVPVNVEGVGRGYGSMEKIASDFKTSVDIKSGSVSKEGTGPHRCERRGPGYLPCP